MSLLKKCEWTAKNIRVLRHVTLPSYSPGVPEYIDKVLVAVDRQAEPLVVLLKLCVVHLSPCYHLCEALSEAAHHLILCTLTCITRHGKCTLSVHVQQTRNIHPMLDQCWASVVNGGQTLVQHWIDVSCLWEDPAHTRC